MPAWNDIQEQIKNSNAHDVLRNNYISEISKITKRNVLVYYSGWLQKPTLSSPNLSITDDDKNGFMICAHKKKDRQKGLDLILHTPGGQVAATESLIDYLHSMYGDNIRAIVPQLSMSGGTLLALSCKEILMGNESSLGPVDPQFGGMAAQSYLSEFEQACAEIKKDPSRLALWQSILGKIQPGFLLTCKNAIDWSKEILINSLEQVMLKNDPNAKQKLDAIVKLFWDQSVSKNHARHINKEQARQAGVNITDLEANDKLQDLVLSLHHLLCLTFQQTTAIKIVTSGINKAYITNVNS